MKKLSRVAAIVLAITLLASVFTGCTKSKPADGDNSQAANTNQAGTNQTTTVQEDKYAPKADKVYEIKYLTMGYAQPSTESDVVKKYNEMFNVKLEGIFIDSAKWDDLLAIKFSSNDIPDVIPAKEGQRLSKYVKQGLLTDVPYEAISKYAPNLTGIIDTETPKAWYTSKINGKNYGIPYIIGTSVYRAPVMWRDDWLKNVGITKTPDTIQEFEDAFIKFTKNDPDQNKKNDTYGLSVSGFESIFGAFGVIARYEMSKTAWQGTWQSKDSKLVYGPVQPGAKEALSLLAKWYKMGLIDPEFVSPNGENKGGYWAISTDFVNGKIGLSSHGFYYHWRKGVEGTSDGAVPTELAKINPNATYTYGLPPLGPDGKTRGILQNSPISRVVYTFSKNLANEPDKIGKILQMFDWPAQSKENWMFNWGGVEGKHYELKDVGGFKVPQALEPYKDPAKASEEGLCAFFYEVDFKNGSSTMPTANDYYTKNNLDKYGVTDELLAPLASQGKYAAELDKILTEGYIKIITGEKPVEYFDEMVEKWNKAGGEVLTGEANEWYDSVK